MQPSSAARASPDAGGDTYQAAIDGRLISDEQTLPALLGAILATTRLSLTTGGGGHLSPRSPP